MIENTPTFTLGQSDKITEIFSRQDCLESLQKIQQDYLYWDKAKYLIPKDIHKESFWNVVAIQRITQSKTISLGKYQFRYSITEKMHELLHEFDMNFGGTFETHNLIPERNKKFYLFNSIMEEAIASSQMEGASTTRKIAKEMLRKNAKPKDKDQRMIANNYETICYLLEKKDEPLTISLLLQIHALISAKTLTNPEEEGTLRQNNDIFVINEIDGEIAHTPPSYKDLEILIQELCDFVNKEQKDCFIHPIVKAICIHFFLSYLHPFVDGNGRTARSLFYWFLLKKGYWLTEYLSISRIIYRNKQRYEKAFLYTEHDNNDLGYFIHYNLISMQKAYQELKSYLTAKIEEDTTSPVLKVFADCNERQLYILNILEEKPQTIFICKEIETLFGVTTKTARADLNQLVQKNYLEKIHLNKRLVGYKKLEEFSPQLEEIRGN